MKTIDRIDGFLVEKQMGVAGGEKSRVHQKAGKKSGMVRKFRKAEKGKKKELCPTCGKKLYERTSDTGWGPDINPKDPSGEREGFIFSTINRAHQLMDYGVLNKAEVKRVTDFMKKTIKY